MKKILSIFLAIIMVFTLSACGEKAPAETIPTPSETIEIPETTLPIDDIQTTEPEEPQPTEPEIKKLSTVSEIMALALDNLANEEYVTVHRDVDEEDKMAAQYHTSIGEVYTYWADEAFDIFYKDEYYIIKDENDYISYIVENQTDKQGNSLKRKISQYQGRQELSIDLTFLDWIEIYLKLNPETEVVDGAECYVLSMLEDAPELYVAEEIIIYIDMNTGKFVKIAANVRGKINNLHFGYEPFEIAMPDDVKTNTVIQEKQYPNEYNGFFPKSTYNSKDKEIYNIIIDNVETVIGEKASFLNIQNKNLTINQNGAYFLDGLMSDEEFEIKDNMVDPKIMIIYNLEYKTEDYIYRWSVITHNNTEEAIEESECTIIAILQSETTPLKETLSLTDLKAVYGNTYERFRGSMEGLVLAWPQEEQTVLTFVDYDEIGMFGVMHNSFYDVMKAIYFVPMEPVEQN